MPARAACANLKKIRAEWVRPHCRTAAPVAQVVDTTGAGDLFASGFLHGLTTGRSLADCGRLGSIAAAEVISHVGPRPLVELRRLVTF